MGDELLISMQLKQEQVEVWWAQPTRLRLVPKIEEITPWETLQKH
jgi:hypothetical protein